MYMQVYTSSYFHKFNSSQPQSQPPLLQLLPDQVLHQLQRFLPAAAGVAAVDGRVKGHGGGLAKRSPGAGSPTRRSWGSHGG